MIISDLLADANKAGDASGTFRVLIATRIVDDAEMEPGQVQVSDAGLPQVDLSGGEVDILPTSYMEPRGPCLTIANFRQLVAEQPEVAGFTVTGVTGFKRLADGGNAQLTEQALGTYVPSDQGEIWLLLHPKSQWPADWLGG
ncbi:hypothetical protein [Dyella amyloliquefaciens]|uniref:hypothetical protein n=1 Tax=Dyella amyloliquefaciens TaxID=1770545 RepID=UPI00102EAB6A|nr:hypothetical protein [Dyella amyloliquefaciens]